MTSTPITREELEKWWHFTNGTGTARCPKCSEYICSWHVARLDDLEKLLESHTNAKVLEARADDLKRYARLVRIAKRYDIRKYISNYNEAARLGWQDLRVPIVRDLTTYDPSEFENLSWGQLKKEQE